MDNNSWDALYEIAKKYYEKMGDLLVPIHYVSEEKVKLGSWISLQRRYYKNGKLSKEKAEMLNMIGMVWEPYDVQWNQYYDVAIKYYKKNGNLLVPLQYITDDGIHLGRWIGWQRKQYKAGKLLKERIDLLNKIGMLWSIYDVQWNEYYDLASDYYKEHGNLLVPLRYKTSDNKKLGYWISDQRQNYKSGKLSEYRIELLEMIEMVWDGKCANWDWMYKIARHYYEEKHNLSISSTTLTYQNASLGSWVVTHIDLHLKLTRV